MNADEARALMTRMDLDSNEQIDLPEFEEYMGALFHEFDDDDISDKLRPLLDGYYLSTKDRPDQLRCDACHRHFL